MKNKRILVLILALCLAICTLSCCGKEKINYDVEVKDGNFESEESVELYWPSGWAPAGTDHLWVSQSHTDDGTGSFMISHYVSSASSSSWNQKINIVENAKYKISCWIKFNEVTSTTENGNGGAYIVLEGCDGYTGKCTKKGVPYTSDWEYFESYYTGAFTGEASLIMRLWGATGTAYFDEIKIELIDKVDPEVSKHYANEKLTEFPKKGSGFTLVAIGDPQAVVCSDSQKYYDGMTNIVKRMKDWNILYAMELGDLVDSCVPAQWDVSVKGHEIFEDAGLRYSLSMGNHDYGNTSSSIIGLSGSDTGEYRLDNPKILKYDHTGFENHYSADKYIDLYGAENFGTICGKMYNTYHKFSYGNDKYMIIALEFAPDEETLMAAKALCDANPDTHIIVTTHVFISPKTMELNNEQTAHLKNVMNSTDMWNKFIRKCPNIFLVCNGHFDCFGNAASVTYNDAGNPVTFICADPQGTLNGGEMMTAFIHFEGGTDFSVYAYCPTKDAFYNGSNYKITLNRGTSNGKGGVIELSKGFTGKIFENVQLDGTGDSITYECKSSNEKAVTIAEDGTIACVGEGSAEITVIIDRHQSAYCVNSNGVTVGSKTKVQVTVVVK